MDLKNMRECDKSKNTCKQQLPIVCMSFLIMLDTLLLVPSLHCNTLLHFTTLHQTTLHSITLHVSGIYMLTHTPGPHTCTIHLQPLQQHTNTQFSFTVLNTIYSSTVVYNQWRTQEFCLGGGGGSTNSVEDRGQRERGSGGR